MSSAPFGQSQRCVVVAAFAGWSDAGAAATATVELLEDASGANDEDAFERDFDADDYYDYQVTRPLVDGNRDHRRWTYPAAKLTVGQLGDRDVAFVSGPEPSFRWRGFCADIIGELAALDPEVVIVLGAALGDVPHTRPSPVQVGAGTETADQFDLTASEYCGPVGITSVFAHECEQAGYPTVTVWTTVPSYASEEPYYPAVVALIDRIGVLTALAADSQGAAVLGGITRTKLHSTVAEDPDLAEYVRQLEERYDERASTGDALAEEFERYLRDRRDRRD